MKWKLLLGTALLAMAGVPALAADLVLAENSQSEGFVARSGVNTSRTQCGFHRRFFTCYAGTIAGPSSLFGESIAQAISVASGGNEIVRKIAVGLGYVSGTNSVTVSLDADNNGLPGSVLASGTAMNIGSKVKVVKVAIPATRIVAHTRYWIAVSAADNTWAAWGAASVDWSNIVNIALDSGDTDWALYSSPVIWWARLN